MSIFNLEESTASAVVVKFYGQEFSRLVKELPKRAEFESQLFSPDNFIPFVPLW